MKCISILLVLLPTLCFAQPNTRIPVEVDIVSVTDRIGDLLAYEVKEGIRRSSTMRLTYDIEPRIRIILHTMAEYGEDSHLACALAVVWVLDRPDDMNIFLGCNLCYCGVDAVEANAKAIVANTDELSFERHIRLYFNTE